MCWLSDELSFKLMGDVLVCGDLFDVHMEANQKAYSSLESVEQGRLQ